MDNNTIIQKAAMAVSDLASGGYMNPMQSDKFIQGIIDEPTIIKDCRTVKIDGENKKIEKIGFGQRIMRKGAENTALTVDQYGKPTTSKVELATKEVIAEVRISYDTLEANIEGQGLKNTLISMIQSRAALDLEELVVNGDKNSADDYLSTIDGLMKKSSKHVVDALGRVPNLGDFTKLNASVPAKYLRDIAAYRMYTSRNVDLSWKNQIAARNTAIGDKFMLEGTNATALGFKIQPIAMMPEAGTTPVVAVTTGATAANTTSIISLVVVADVEEQAYVGRQLTLTVAAQTRTIISDVRVDATHRLVTVDTPFSAVPNAAAGTIDARENLGSVLLVHPKNIIVGFTRKVQMEMDKDISARQIIIVTTMKMDMAIEEDDAVGKLINVYPKF